MKKAALFIIPVLVIIALSFKNNENYRPAGASLCDSLNLSAQEYLVMSVLWYQRSAEMKALYYQSYNLAKLTLDNKLKDADPAGKYAVVLDVDETVLDNSPFEAKMIVTGQSFSSKAWKEWTQQANAKPTPGVVDFLSYAKSKGVAIFYVTNRDLDERQATIKNMLAERIPNADTLHLLCKSSNSDKTARYKDIGKTYSILLTIGDNLRDFNEIFADRKINYGCSMADSLKSQFGLNFIALPNPMYGDWEKAIYGGKNLSEVEKSKMRKAALKSY